MKRKIRLRVLAMIVAAAAAIGFAYRGIWLGRVGDWIVYFFRNVLGLDKYDALRLYDEIFRDNFGVIMFAAMSVVFLIIFNFSLTWFTKYFKDIDRGLDALLSNDGEKIELLPDLEAIEIKLNTIQQTLEKRAIETQMSEQRKNELVMYLAHDIRTPLTSVIGYLNLLDEAGDMPPDQRAKYVHITLEKAYRLEGFINEFFEIIRYNSQQITLEKESVDLYYMLAQVADELYPTMSARGNSVKIITDSDVTIFGDSNKLARVFNNILKNAAAYSRPNTDIIVAYKVSGNTVQIAFQNKGNTIPADKLARLFEKFYRLDEARVSNTGGTGLGLSIAQEIVTLHGGSISAHSENNTVTFIVTLPIAQ